MATLQHLVFHSLGSKHIDKSLDASPDQMYSAAKADQVDLWVAKVTPCCLEHNIIVSIAIVDHHPECKGAAVNQRYPQEVRKEE